MTWWSTTSFNFYWPWHPGHQATPLGALDGLGNMEVGGPQGRAMRRGWATHVGEAFGIPHPFTTIGSTCTGIRR